MPVHRGAFPAHLPNPLIEPMLSAAVDKPFVIAQLGQSLDGRIATPSGASRWINGSAALDHLHNLRANVDAVVVGAGTVEEDDPLLTVRRVRGPHPARVVIDPNGRIKHAAKCFARDGTRCFIVRADAGVGPDGTETVIVPREEGKMPPGAIVKALFALGLRKILIEGGAKTVSAFIDADVVDRLHVLVAPVILGSGISGLSLSPILGLEEARRPVTRVHVLDGGDVVFDCDLRQKSKGQ